MASDKTAANKQAQHGSVLINGQKYPLPGPVIQNIEKVIGLQNRQEQNVPANERLLTKIAEASGRPQFLYYQLAALVTWWTCSRLIDAGILNWNIPTLQLGDQIIDVASLLIATGVLVRQTRQDKISEQRSHLMLQINLLNEQKIAKVIELLEELRTDLPTVKNRYDWEADIMQKSTDPQMVLNILQDNLDHKPDSDLTNVSISEPNNSKSEIEIAQD